MLRPWADALALCALRKDPDGKTKLNKIAAVTVKRALAGDQWAIKEIGERLDGRVNLQPDDVAKDVGDLKGALISSLIEALVEKKRDGDGAKVIEGDVASSVDEMVAAKRSEQDG